MNNKSWINEALPDGVSLVPEKDQPPILARFDELVSLRHAPIYGTSRSENYAFFWPNPPLIAKAIPGGVASLDVEEGYNYDTCMDRFFFEIGDLQVYFWAIHRENIGIFKGTYNEDVRWWIKRNIIASPTVIMSVKLNVVLISDEQWHFSVVGGQSGIISTLERVFGGAEQLKSNFIDWAEDNGVGFGDEGKIWAYEYPIPWSGWNL